MNDSEQREQLVVAMSAVAAEHRASLDQVLGAYILAMLRLHEGNATAACKVLQLDRRTFYRWRHRSWSRRTKKKE